jgi:hypothetical protein
MGLLNWISGLFQPPEVREAMHEGEKAIREAEAKERQNALSGKDFRAEMRQGAKAVAAQERRLHELKKIAEKELAKDPRPGVPMRKADEAAWFKSFKHDSQKEAELIRSIEKSGKVMKTDALERQAESMSKMLSTLAGNLKEAEKVALRVTQQVTSQENEIDRLASLLAKREELSAQVAEVAEKRMQVFNKETIKRGQQLMEQIGRVDQEILASYQRITTMADASSRLRSDIEFIEQILAPATIDADILSKRVKDEINYARKMLAFEANILSAMKPALKAKKTEIERVAVFMAEYRKAA